jgi:hypothetical protein
MFPANLNTALADLINSSSDNIVEMDSFGFTIENRRLRLTYYRENGIFHQVTLDILITPIIQLEGFITLQQGKVSEINTQHIYALTKDPKSEEPSFIIAETTLEKEPELTLEDFCGYKEKYEFIKELKDFSREFRKDVTVEPRQEWFVYANRVLGNSLEKLDFINVYTKWESEYRKKKETKSFLDHFSLKTLADYLRS